MLSGTHIKDEGVWETVFFHCSLNICHCWGLHQGSLLVVNVKWYFFGVCFLEQRVFWWAGEH